MGSSHGRSRRERMTPFSGNLLLKKTASASPIVNCPAIDPTVNRTVLPSAVVKMEDPMTDA